MYVYLYICIYIEAPWIFSLSKLPRSDKNNSGSGTRVLTPTSGTHAASSITTRSTVYTSVFGFNSFENYVFVPLWMLKSLNVHAGDVVRLTFHPYMKYLSKIKVQPSYQWRKLLARDMDQNDMKHFNSTIISQLEKGLSDYSTLSLGGIILLNINGEQFSLKVLNTTSREGGILQVGLLTDDTLVCLCMPCVLMWCVDVICWVPM